MKRCATAEAMRGVAEHRTAEQRGGYGMQRYAEQ